MTLSMEDAKCKFIEILKSLDNENISLFKEFVTYTFQQQENDHQHNSKANEPSAVPMMSSERMLMIKHDLKAMLPVEAMLPSERVCFPTHGEHHGSSNTNTCHVDGFLYDDDEVDDLCDNGKMSRNYCKDCGSRNTVPLNFISHSMSDVQLRFIFRYVLPDLTGKCILDVGSRIGAVLYGAYHYSNAAQIIGVEVNEDLCAVQNKIIQTYQLADRVKVIQGDICYQASLLASADIVVLHNVFEFFTPMELQAQIWNFLRRAIYKPGTVLIIAPSLQQTLQVLVNSGTIQIDFDPNTWLEKQDVTSQRAAATADLHLQEDDLDILHFYIVR